jgi:hypothetical protein
MTSLILLTGLAAAIATVVGYVVWRDRRGRGSFVDPSISRVALAQADQQAVQGLVAHRFMPVGGSVGHRAGSQSRTNRT